MSAVRLRTCAINTAGLCLIRQKQAVCAALLSTVRADMRLLKLAAFCVQMMAAKAGDWLKAAMGIPASKVRLNRLSILMCTPFKFIHPRQTLSMRQQVADFIGRPMAAKHGNCFTIVTAAQPGLTLQIPCTSSLAPQITSTRLGRIEESHDGGQTWNLASTGLQVPWRNHMVERFTQIDSELFAVLSNGELLVAQLSNLHWRRILLDITDVNAVTGHFDPDV